MLNIIKRHVLTRLHLQPDDGNVISSYDDTATLLSNDYCTGRLFLIIDFLIAFLIDIQDIIIRSLILTQSSFVAFINSLPADVKTRRCAQSTKTGF